MYGRLWKNRARKEKGVLLSKTEASEPRREYTLRADAAFYDGRFIASLEQRRAQYVIAARLTRPLKHRLGGLRYRQVRRELWTAEFRYRPQGWEHPARFVVIRRPAPEEPSAQLHLFEMKGYTYFPACGCPNESGSETGNGVARRMKI